MFIKIGHKERRDFPRGDSGREEDGLDGTTSARDKEGGVCLTLLRVTEEERLPLGDNGCCFKEILTAESDSVAGREL